MNDEHSPEWGGTRPGAGRKPRYDEPMVQKTVRLPPSWVEQLVDEFGSFQAAIETLAKRHIEDRSEERS